MGGDLKAAPAGKAQGILIRARRDADGANLDRVQVVKGWLDAAGKTQEKVYDVVRSGGLPGCDKASRKRGRGESGGGRAKHTFQPATGLRNTSRETALYLSQGLLQYLAVVAPQRAWNSFGSWLRTIRPGIPPSEFVVANALRQTLPDFLLAPSKSNSLTKIHHRTSGHRRDAHVPIGILNRKCHS